jgi:hypothetical protein
MGQARQRALNGTPSIGDNWKWAQRDFEERPAHFLVRHNYHHPVVKKLNRLMKRIEKKHEVTNPKAALDLAFLAGRFEKLSAKRDAILDRLNPLKG